MAQDQEFRVMHDFVAAARANVTDGAWDYLMGGSETETTFNRNREALDSVAFCPRVLRDVSEIDTRTKLFGYDLSMPVVLAPIGSLEDLIPEGATVPTRAAAEFGNMHMLSSVAKPGLEKVAAEVDYPKLFQLYIRGDEFWTDEIIARAVDNGFAAICLTVDRAYYGRRDRNLAKTFRPTAQVGAAEEVFQARLSWADVERIRSNIDVPLILKGIATTQDAIMALDHGVDGIYISNHGGRQLDHGKGSVELLPRIVDAVAGRATIMVDGSIMRGTDVIKAIALGADAVGVGRLQGLAGAAGGQAGIVRMLGIMEDEIRNCMGLLGVKSFSELNREYIEPATPSGRKGIDSVFPLLGEGY
jgi:isopentenyl diphosphate isomerase/L-lactate dehydrogenase-like FMN-dependent dehydrogenase